MLQVGQLFDKNYIVQLWFTKVGRFPKVNKNIKTLAFKLAKPGFV